MFYYLLVVILFYSLYQHPLPLEFPLSSLSNPPPARHQHTIHDYRSKVIHFIDTGQGPGKKIIPGMEKKKGAARGPRTKTMKEHTRKEEKRKEKKRGKENGDRRGRDNKQHPRKYFLKNKRTEEQKDGRLKEGEILLREKQRTEHAIFTE